MKKERLTFLGTLYPNEAIPELLKDAIGNLQFAGDTFQKALIEGLTPKYNLRIITAFQVGSFPKRFRSLCLKKYVQYSTDNIRVVPYFNLTLYKELSIKRHVKHYLKKLDYFDNEKIIVYNMSYALLSAAVSIKRKNPRIHIHFIITDITEFMSPSKIATIINKYFQRKIIKLFPYVDSFTVMTKYMVDKLGIKKNYTIVEGICNTNPLEPIKNDSEKAFIILYTGTLEKRYGILHLINSFEMLNSETDIKLWICGNGDAKNIVESYCKKDKRITYFGLLPRNEVLQLQQKANLLVNPRFSTDEYTLYSFPSKTIEYMFSGTPVCMHRLPGIPKEYEPYLFYADDETDEGFARTIQKIIMKEPQELMEKGKKAQQFIINNKNCYKQAEKIYEVMNE